MENGFLLFFRIFFLPFRFLIWIKSRQTMSYLLSGPPSHICYRAGRMETFSFPCCARFGFCYAWACSALPYWNVNLKCVFFELLGMFSASVSWWIKNVCQVLTVLVNGFTCFLYVRDSGTVTVADFPMLEYACWLVLMTVGINLIWETNWNRKLLFSAGNLLSIQYKWEQPCGCFNFF